MIGYKVKNYSGQEYKHLQFLFFSVFGLMCYLSNIEVVYVLLFLNYKIIYKMSHRPCMSHFKYNIKYRFLLFEVTMLNAVIETEGMNSKVEILVDLLLLILRSCKITKP